MRLPDARAFESLRRDTFEDLRGGAQRRLALEACANGVLTVCRYVCSGAGPF